MSAKSVIAVVMVAILIGVLYVLFEKNFSGGVKSLGNSQTSSSQELAKQSNSSTPPTTQPTSVINYPSPTSSPAPITSSTDLSQETSNLEMRDYSGMFEELKDSVNK